MRYEGVIDLLEYRDGELYWKVTRRGKTRKGVKAGNKKADGYVRVKYGGKLLYAHRIIYTMFHGPIPEGMEIDHIDGNRSNNRIENLRCVDKATNLRAAAKRLRKTNKSGVTGVYYHKRHKGWVARIRVDGKIIDLGFRKDFFEAVCLRKSAEVRYRWNEL